MVKSLKTTLALLGVVSAYRLNHSLVQLSDDEMSISDMMGQINQNKPEPPKPENKPVEASLSQQATDEGSKKSEAPS